VAELNKDAASNLIIQLAKVGHAYGKQRLFSGLSATFGPGLHAIIGANGSGKSTLMRLIAAQESPQRGSIIYQLNGAALETDNLFRHLTWAAPYIEPPDALSFLELWKTQSAFKQALNEPSCFGREIGLLETAWKKPLKSLSSGQKRRVCLALAFGFDARLLLLDEPTANLDASGVERFVFLRNEAIARGATVIVASNDPREYEGANTSLRLEVETSIA